MPVIISSLDLSAFMALGPPVTGIFLCCDISVFSYTHFVMRLKSTASSNKSLQSVQEVSLVALLFGNPLTKRTIALIVGYIGNLKDRKMLLHTYVGDLKKKKKKI